MGSPTSLSVLFSLIHQTDSSANPFLARLRFIWAHQSTSPPAPAISSPILLHLLSSSLQLTPPLAVARSTVLLPATACSSRIPKIDLFIQGLIVLKNKRVKTLSGWVWFLNRKGLFCLYIMFFDRFPQPLLYTLYCTMWWDLIVSCDGYIWPGIMPFDGRIAILALSWTFPSEEI